MGSAIITLIISLVSSRIFCCSFFSNNIYLSDKTPRMESIISYDSGLKAPVKKDIFSLGPVISAESAILVDKKSGAVLFAKNQDLVRPIASITKFMTALVALDEDPDLSQKITMTEEDDREGGRRYILPKESASLHSFLKASIIGSANNATMTLSRSVGLEDNEFVSRMNKKALDLGMKNTVFVEPTGLAIENVSTARDISLLLDEVSKNEILIKLSSLWSDEIIVSPSGEKRKITSTNHLIGSIVKVDFGKTGYLDESLYNLATGVSLSNRAQVYAILLGAKTNEDRVQDAKNLAVWAQSTYLWD